MASTKLSDINFQTPLFADHLFGEFTSRVAFLTSGVLQNAGNVRVQGVPLSQATGYSVAIPKFAALSGDSAQITDSSSTSIESLGDVKDIGVWVEREKAWGADEMLQVVSGVDVTAEVARQIGGYWARELHRIAGRTRTGVFATALATTHSTGATFTGGLISYEAIAAVKQLLGDNKDLMTDMIWHSKVQNDALNARILYNDTDTRQGYMSGQVPMVAGMRTHMQDATLEAVASVYSSYVAAQGSMIYTLRDRRKNSLSNANQFTITSPELGMSIDIELNRVAKTAGGQDEIITRASIMTHVPGVAYSSATMNPTDAQLATGGNYTKVYTDDKLIRIAQLKTA